MSKPSYIAELGFLIGKMDSGFPGNNIYTKAVQSGRGQGQAPLGSG